MLLKNQIVSVFMNRKFLEQQKVSLSVKAEIEGIRLKLPDY